MIIKNEDYFIGKDSLESFFFCSKSIEIPYVPVAVKYLGGIRRLESVRALCLERLPRLKVGYRCWLQPWIPKFIYFLV